MDDFGLTDVLYYGHLDLHYLGDCDVFLNYLLHLDDVRDCLVLDDDVGDDLWHTHDLLLE